jgi:hypothetical protein
MLLKAGKYNARFAEGLEVDFEIKKSYGHSMKDMLYAFTFTFFLIRLKKEGSSHLTTFIC